MAINLKDGVGLPSAPAWQQEVNITQTHIAKPSPGETIGSSPYWPGFHHAAITDRDALQRAADSLIAAHKSLRGFSGDVDKNIAIRPPEKK
jgi:hypothetical protein